MRRRKTAILLHPASKVKMSKEERLQQPLVIQVGALAKNSPTTNFAEYTFRSRRMPLGNPHKKDGYWVSLAAVVLPDIGKIFIGASACAPEDAPNFDRDDAAVRATARARELALKTTIANAKTPPIEEVDHTLIGSVEDSIRDLPPNMTQQMMVDMVEPLYAQVAKNAEMVGARKVHQRVQRLLRQRFPNAHFTVLTA